MLKETMEDIYELKQNKQNTCFNCCWGSDNGKFKQSSWIWFPGNLWVIFLWQNKKSTEKSSLKCTMSIKRSKTWGLIGKKENETQRIIHDILLSFFRRVRKSKLIKKNGKMYKINERQILMISSYLLYFYREQKLKFIPHSLSTILSLSSKSNLYATLSPIFDQTISLFIIL